MKRTNKMQKREKTTPIQKTKKKNTTPPIDKLPVANYMKYFNVWSLLGLILIIGIVAFGGYISTELLFFFKDIGSDSLNQDYPGIIHVSKLRAESFSNNWSFYVGMGSVDAVGFPTDPYSFFRRILDMIGISVWDANYLIYGRFIRSFVFFFIFTGIIAYYYFRTLSVDKFTALIASLLIVYSGYMVVGNGWNFSSHVFKAIFLLFAFEQLYVKKRWYFFPFAIMFLSSNLFVFYIYIVFLVVYGIFRLVDDNVKLKSLLQLVGKTVALGLIGLLMNMVNIFHGFVKMFNSPRVAGNASYSQYLSEGIDITDQANVGATTILRFFSSDILGTGSHFKGWNNYLEAPLFYIGLLTLLVLPQVFTYLNRRSKIVFGSFLGFWLLTLFVPFLRYTILAYTGDYFRYGFDFFIPFTFLFYAVYALNKMDKGFKINPKLLGGTLVLLLVLLFFPYKSIKISAIDNGIRMLVVFFLFAYSGLLLLFSNEKYRNYAQIGIVVLLCFELGYFSYKSYEKRVPVTKREFKKDKAGYADGSIKAVEYIKANDETLFYRTEKDYNSGNAEHSSLNDALAQGYYGTASYSSFNQLNYIRFLEETEVITKGIEDQTRWAPGFKGLPLLQTFGSIKYHLSKSDNPAFKRFGFDSIATVKSVKIFKNKYYLPFGFTYDKYMNFVDFQQLSKFNKQIALLNGFVYEEDGFCKVKTDNFTSLNIADTSIFVDDKGFNFQLYQQFTDSLRKDTFAISSFKQDQIKGTITLEKPKLLFFTIPFDEGWKAIVNGKEEKLSRVNIGFTGIELPAGTHEIELQFIPKYYALTSWVSWISVVLFWLYLGYYLYKRKRSRVSKLSNN